MQHFSLFATLLRHFARAAVILFVSRQSGTVSACAYFRVGLLLGLIVPAGAADDLLDPNAIVIPRRSVNSTPAEAPVAGVRSSAAGDNAQYSRGYPRGMATAVVSSLFGLSKSYTNLCESVAQLEASIKQMDAKRIKQIDSKAAEMADYRAGLFCSGCNQTKTQILALGEKFPHPGQHIIRPTPEQIAAKDRELQAPIDRLEKDIQDSRSKREKSDKERLEAAEQIRYGFKLWRTAVIFEGRIFFREEREIEAAFVRSLAAAKSQIAKLQSEIAKADKEFHDALGPRKNAVLKLQNQLQQTDDAHQTERTQFEEKIAALRSQRAKLGSDSEEAGALGSQISDLAAQLAQNVATYKEARATLEKQFDSLQLGNLRAVYERLRNELTRELTFWTLKSGSIIKQHDEDVRLHQQRFAASSAARDKEQGQLSAIVNSSSPMRVILEIANIPLTTFAQYYVDYGAFSELGGYYRMGDYQPSRHNEVLPSVQRFIDAYRRTDNYRQVRAAEGNQTPAPADKGLIPALKSNLRELLDVPLAPPPAKAKPRATE